MFDIQTPCCSAPFLLTYASIQYTCTSCGVSEPADVLRNPCGCVPASSGWTSTLVMQQTAFKSIPDRFYLYCDKCESEWYSNGTLLQMSDIWANKEGVAPPLADFQPFY